MAKKDDVLAKLVEKYDAAREKANDAAKEQKEIQAEIKALVKEGTDEVYGHFRVTYLRDQDREIEVCDFERLKKENAKLYKKYCKTEITKGSLRLNIKSVDEQEA